MTSTYFDILPKELLYIVQYNLNGPDAHKFSQLYDLKMELYTVAVAGALEDRLKELFGSDYHEIKKFMQDNNVIISGSYILQLLLNEEYNTDIDFYMLTDFDGCDSGGNYLGENFPTVSLPNIQMEEIKDCHIYQYLNGLDIYYLYTYKYKGKLLQFICLNEKNIRRTNNVYNDIWNYIIYAFDFNICKSMYYINCNKSYVNIYDIDNIYKRLIIVQNINTYTMAERIRKYISRGFILHNIHFKGILSMIPPKLNNTRVLICDNERSIRGDIYANDDEIYDQSAIDKYLPSYYLVDATCEIEKGIYILNTRPPQGQRRYLKLQHHNRSVLTFYAFKSKTVE